MAVARARALTPAQVLAIVAKAPGRIRRIHRGPRGFFRRSWLVLRDVVVRPTLGL